MENTKEKKPKTKKVILIISAAVVVLGLATCGYLQMIKPYAITADDKDIVLVKDSNAAEQVIDGLMTAYAADGSKIKSINVDKDLKFSIVKLWEDYDKSDVMTEKQAIAYIEKQNASNKPLFTATVVGNTKGKEEYIPEIEYKKDDSMFAGDSRVEVEGKSGTQMVTRAITTVNGVETDNKVIKAKVLDKGVAQVLYKGTRGLPEDADWKTYEGDPVFASGQEMVDYSERYLRAPYKYGGYSFVTGIDCVQFVRAMYKKYGIILPNNHSGIRSSGTGVSLANAKAGDIVCYTGHMALYLGNGKVIHATRKSGIKISSVHVKGKKLLTIRRVVD